MINLIHIKPGVNFISQSGVGREFKELNDDQQGFIKQQDVTGVRLDDNSIIYMNVNKISWINIRYNITEIIDTCNHVLLALSCSGEDSERLQNALVRHGR